MAHFGHCLAMFLLIVTVAVVVAIDEHESYGGLEAERDEEDKKL